MNAVARRSLTLLIAGASDALSLEVSQHLAKAVDCSPPAAGGDGDVDWSAHAGTGGAHPLVVDVSRLPFERENSSRRRRLLGKVDVVVLVVDAIEPALPAAVAALQDVRSGLGDRVCPLVVFGIGGTAKGGDDAGTLRRHLELADQDVIIVGSASDRERLRQVFAFAVRAALTPPPDSGAGTVESAPLDPPSPSGTSARIGAPPTVVEPPEAVEPAPLELFGPDDAFVELVLDHAVAGTRGVVEVATADWALLSELVGSIALIRGSGDERREALVRELLAKRLLVDRRTVVSGVAVDLFNQPVADAGAPVDLVAGEDEQEPSADDRFRALKELRRQLLG